MKISFVIPAYNTAEYLHKCVNSIIDQRFQNFEIIIINDGSTDDTLSIAQAYAKKDQRFRVIDKKNAGQGAARNDGVQAASGDYIWFVDSDDWLQPHSLLRITELLKSEAPDVFVINFEYTFDDAPPQPSSLVPPHLSGHTIRPRDNQGDFGAVSCWQAPPWRLISKREFLLKHDIRFAEGIFYEDHPYAIQLMLIANRVFVHGPVVYGYLQRATATTKVNDKKAFDFVPIRRMALDLFAKFGETEEFTSHIISYLAPVDFFNAHVAPEFQREFLKQLGADTSEAEKLIIKRYGNDTANRFAAAAAAADPELLNTPPMGNAVENITRRRNYNPASAWRFVGRVRKRAEDKLISQVVRLKNRANEQAAVHSPTHHAGIDTTGSRFMDAADTARTEAFVIDVRVTQKDRPYVTIGANSHVGGEFVFERGIGEITIGEGSSIGGGCKFVCTQEGGIHIGNNVMLSWDCTVVDSNFHSLNPDIRTNDAYDWKCGMDAGQMGAYKEWTGVDCAPIHIEDQVWVGFDSAIMKGVTIGKGAVIGSKSVVTKDVAPFCIYAGSPAQFIGFVPRDRWEWEEIVAAFHGDPEKQDMLKDAYLHKDNIDGLKRYRESAEFKSLLEEIETTNPDARNILDVGGGNGVTTIALALAGFEVTLAEPSNGSVAGTAAAEKLLEHTSKNIDKTILQRVKIINSSIQDLELQRTKFDLAHCRQVVHHFSDPVRELKTIAGHLKSEGHIFLVRDHVVFDEEDREFFEEHHPFHEYTHDEQGYRPESYVEFLSEANFEVLTVYKFGDSPINYYPHSAEVVASLDERDVAGRPYTFIAKRA